MLTPETEIASRTAREPVKSVTDLAAETVGSMTRYKIRPGTAIIWGITAVVSLAAVSNEYFKLGTSKDRSQLGHSLASSEVCALSPQFLSAYREMDSYKYLREGWDGYGSIKPLPGVVEDALAFLRSLPPNMTAPEATVSADGTAGWFWSAPTLYASVVFLGDRRMAYWAQADKAQPAKGALLFDGHAIPNDLLEVIRLA